MKEVKNIIKVSLTYNELMNCKVVNANRCGYHSRTEAIANGWSEVRWEEFVKRAKKMLKIIKENGFAKSSHFTIVKGVDGNLYILDGQGRRFALKMMHDNDGIDFSNWDFVCDYYVTPMTEEEMVKTIKSLNTGNTNWKTRELRRADALASNDEEVKKAFDVTQKLIDDYGINDYVANLLTFGERASHMRKNVEMLSTKNYSVTKDLFTNAYIKFITKASNNLIDRNGNEVTRSLSVQRKIKGVDFAISLNSCMRGIIKENTINRKIDFEKAKEDIDYLINILINKVFKGDDKYILQMMHNTDKKKEFVANLVKPYLKNKTTRINVVKGLFAEETR